MLGLAWSPFPIGSHRGDDRASTNRFEWNSLNGPTHKTNHYVPQAQKRRYYRHNLRHLQFGVHLGVTKSMKIGCATVTIVTDPLIFFRQPSFRTSWRKLYPLPTTQSALAVAVAQRWSLVVSVCLSVAVVAPQVCLLCRRPSVEPDQF